MSHLIYGDNLNVLRHMESETIDLIYLDPPYNSKRDYNVTFGSVAQSKAFKDTWTWDDADDIHLRELAEINPGLSSFLLGLGAVLPKRGLYPYLVNMAVRLVEMRRVLKDTGSIYLHVDPTASHYLKLVMDQIFGGGNFRSEIVWQRTNAHNDKAITMFPRIHDVILYYQKGKGSTWNTQFTPYQEGYTDKAYNKKDSRGWFKTSDLSANKVGPSHEWKGHLPPPGRYWAYSEDNMIQLDREGRIYYSKTGKPYLKNYLHEMQGIPLQDVWVDIQGPRGLEATGYPTQKPLALLERIIKASSNEGDVVLDPYMGSGTTIEAAAKHGRKWIGIDVTHHAVATTVGRLQDCGIEITKDQVIGVPEDVASARQLKSDSPRQFDAWCVLQCQAMPSDDGERIIGLRHFPSISKGKEHLRRALYMATHDDPPTMQDIKDCVAKMRRNGCELGFLYCFEMPEDPAVLHFLQNQGHFHDDMRSIPAIQLITMRDLLHGNSAANLTSEWRQRRLRDLSNQLELV